MKNMTDEERDELFERSQVLEAFLKRAEQERDNALRQAREYSIELASYKEQVILLTETLKFSTQTVFKLTNSYDID